MQFQVSARIWRPQTFEEVIGQKQLIQILTHAITQQKTAQAYLFTGMRGVGKTTVARILAKALNCADSQKRPCNTCASCMEITEDRSVDVLQIDGASNTSVDHVRELREMVKYRPMRGQYKVIIIDETHMLSNAAWNALLKTLEEPPPHLVFIFATTEAHKIPATIISRCQQFIFHRITRSDIEQHLKKVANTLNAPIPDRVLAFIAKASEGSLRDALSLLDQAIAYGGHAVTEETLSTLFGRVAGTVLHHLIRGIHEKNAEALLNIARQIENGGYDLRQFLLDWCEYLRHLLVIKYVKETDPLIDLPEEEKKEALQEASLFSQEALHRLFTLFVKLHDEIKNAPRPYILFEVALLKAILLADLTPIETILEQFQAQTDEQTSPDPTPLKNSASAPKNTGSHAQDHHGEVLQTSPAPTLDTGNAWSDLLQEVLRKRPLLASCLDYGKEEIDIQAGIIKIHFSQENYLSRDMIQKEENRTWLSALAQGYFKREMQIVCVSQGASGNTHEASRLEHHPLVREVLNVFKEAVIKGGQ